MTRETKIGLLVGLAFIIVIGILLSDHLTSSTEPPQATLAVAGNNVRSGVTTPGAATVPPITTTVAPPPVQPAQPVPTPNDLAPRPQPVQPVEVAVGGPAHVAPPAGHPSHPQGGPVVQVAPPIETPVVVESGRASAHVNAAPSNDSEPVITRSPVVATNENPSNNPVVSIDPVTTTEEPIATPITSHSEIPAALRQTAQQHGVELVSVGSGSNGSAGATSVQMQPGPNGMQQYVAVEGDSLSRIAAKCLGANTRANREAIINANPALRANPDIIVSGRKYNIPAAPAVAVTSNPSNNSVSSGHPHVIQAPPLTQTEPVSSSENWYVVKEGDSLWKIATEQCGSPSAIAAIRELNKDTLRGDTVVINTKLRLPNKVVASN